MGFIAGWIEKGAKDQINEQFRSDFIEKVCQFSPSPFSKIIKPFIVFAARKDLVLEDGPLICAASDDYYGRREKMQKAAAQFHRMDGNSLSLLVGKGALLIAEIDHPKLILATDPIGQTNLYYAETRNGLVFASSADYIIEHPDVSAEISLQSIYDYVYFHHCPSPTTIYKQVKKLEGGQMLIYQDGTVTIKRYWMPEFLEQPVKLDDAGCELRDLINEVVRGFAGSAEETGAFLSGGLDSSTVAGALSTVFPKKAKTFSMGFPVEGYDEINYARMAVKQFQTSPHEYYITPEDTVSAVAKIAAFYDEPFGNSSALAAYYCAKLARENGTKMLLAGDGGDELFAGNERYAKQLLFDRFHKIPAMVKEGLKKGLFHAPGLLLKNKIIYKAKRYIEQAEVPLPDRLQDYNFLNRHSTGEIFDDSFINQIDPSLPLQSLRESYNRPRQASALNRMLYMDWKTTLHDNDLVKVNRMCEMVGVDVQYPLLSQPIVDFSCKIPSDDKLKGQELRWFYKQAMKGVLPESIINKSKHGFGLPFGIWLQNHHPLQELAYDSIASLKARGYFQEKFLNHAIEMHQSIHASYYGELIWVLMMLELWLRGKHI